MKKQVVVIHGGTAFDTYEKYKNALSKSEVIVFTDRQHFNQEYFPELIELLKIL